MEFDEVKGRIIGRNPQSSINEVFSEVHREESRKYVMLGKKNKPNSITEGSTFVTVEAHASRRSGPNLKKNEEKPRVWCDHCHKPRHTKDTCWLIHGKPADWKPKNKRLQPSANAAVEQPILFSQEQIDQLLKLLKSNPNAGIPNCSIAHSGKTFSPWIIDSGASDHMTSLAYLFHSYIPCSGHEKSALLMEVSLLLLVKVMLKFPRVYISNLYFMLLILLVTLYLLVSFPKILIVVLFFVIPIVSFRTSTRGR